MPTREVAHQLTEEIIGLLLARNIYRKDGSFVIVSKNTVISQFVFDRLKREGIHTVHIWKDVPDHVAGGISEFKEFKEEYSNKVNSLEKAFSSIVETNNVDVKQVDTLVNSLKQSDLSKRNMFSYLSNLESLDDITYVHSMNVSMMAGLMATWLEFDDAQRSVLMMCGILHDVGKTLIKESTLKKPGPLTPVELVEMKTHTILGHELLKNTDVPQEVKDVALYHHERVGGVGYPKGLDLDEIPYYARIIAILDVYDAMSHARVYREKTSSPFTILRTFRESVYGQLDVELLDVFLSNVAYMYLGDRCVLSDGREGEIIFINPTEIQSPMIKVGAQYVDLKERRDLHIEKVIMK